MADFARYLPLSQRSGFDERGVTSDRREPTAIVLRAIAVAVRAGGDAGWSASTGELPPAVPTALAELMAGFDRAPARRAFETAQHALGMSPREADADLTVEGPADAAAARRRATAPEARGCTRICVPSASPMRTAATTASSSSTSLVGCGRSLIVTARASLSLIHI